MSSELGLDGVLEDAALAMRARSVPPGLVLEQAPVLACEREGCRLLLWLLHNGKPDDVHRIWAAIAPVATELMTQAYGHYVIQAVVASGLSAVTYVPLACLRLPRRADWDGLAQMLSQASQPHHASRAPASHAGSASRPVEEEEDRVQLGGRGGHALFGATRRRGRSCSSAHLALHIPKLVFVTQPSRLIGLRPTMG